MENAATPLPLMPAASPGAGTPGRPETTAAVARGAARLFRDMGLAVLAEFSLPNGRRTDLCGLSRDGRLIVAEVKSCVDDYASDAKWTDYPSYCDAFYFAVSASFPREALPADFGVIVADAWGGAVLRPAPARPLAPARRRTLTLRFARQAALRGGVAP